MKIFIIKKINKLFFFKLNIYNPMYEFYILLK